MKRDRILIDILKQLLKDPEKVSIQFSEDGEDVLVILNAAVGYKLDTAELPITLESAQHIFGYEKYLAYSLGRSLQHQLLATDEYRMGGCARKFLFDGDPELPVYVNTKLLASFHDPKLYQMGYSETGVCVVTEFPYGDSLPVVVGIVAPTKIKTEEE